jgi:hypothetical protein
MTGACLAASANGRSGAAGRANTIAPRHGQRPPEIGLVRADAGADARGVTRAR